MAGPLVAGLLALAAAALAAVGTALSADKKSAAATAAGNAYIELRDELRQVRRLDLPVAPVVDTRQTIRELTARVHEVNKSAPIPGRWAWRAVQRAERRAQSPREVGDAELDRLSVQADAG